METIERTPTPRESLFALHTKITNNLANDFLFYNELSHRHYAENIDIADIDGAVIDFCETFNKPLHDDEGEELEKFDFLKAFRVQQERLAEQIHTALTTNKFDALLIFLEEEQKLIHDNTLFSALSQNLEVILDAELDTLTDWYNDLITETIKLCERIYTEPEFML